MQTRRSSLAPAATIKKTDSSTQMNNVVVDDTQDVPVERDVASLTNVTDVNQLSTEMLKTKNSILNSELDVQSKPTVREILAPWLKPVILTICGFLVLGIALYFFGFANSGDQIQEEPEPIQPLTWDQWLSDIYLWIISQFDSLFAILSFSAPPEPAQEPDDSWSTYFTHSACGVSKSIGYDYFCIPEPPAPEPTMSEQVFQYVDEVYQSLW
ncbi:uncharacterized protein [Clytia hemisphaerica]|uniref:uncharacterized protein n=1 Tax=Clytia hemisphaerica TaxID=252671 RepID=UPI0034D56774